MGTVEVLRPHIEDILNTSIVSYKPLSGGDISAVFKIETPKGAFVLKHSSLNGESLFKSEAQGLDLIAKSQSFSTPKVTAVGTYNDVAYLLMDFIPTKSPDKYDYIKLGKQLAKLHLCHGDTFGLSTDNYIGTLAQKNKYCNNWVDFYSTNRLGFQINLAHSKGLLKSSEIPTLNAISSVLESFCSDVKPSLLHGDLWSGNYLIAEDGTPYLIDPAVYYGHAEVDIAMSKLFGGFSSYFYGAYHDVHPISNYFNERVELYQLYFLLVHLNLFGSSYYGSVKRIISLYF